VTHLVLLLQSAPHIVPVIVKLDLLWLLLLALQRAFSNWSCSRIMLSMALGPSFRKFIASIHTRDSPILFNELYDKLVDFEMFLQREESMNTSLSVTANHVQRRHPGNGHNRGRNYNNRVFDPVSSSTKKTFVVCQYCDIPGHSARSCYKICGYPKKCVQVQTYIQSTCLSCLHLTNTQALASTP
ncbi:hypothetical protein A2U01_0025304, partial [Trifolium medium]|nr:hypothetical protein [Trifolium medium]